MNKPLVLSIAAHDPTGGAGIQADIESVNANGCSAVSIITALTEQNLSDGVTAIYPQDIKTFKYQLKSIMEEYSFDAVKIGVIANIQQLESIIDVLDNTDTAIVLDPVIQSTSGFLFYDDDFIDCLIHKLMPLCSIITPNQQEASILYSHANCTNADEFLQKISPKSVLITSSKIEGNLLSHTLVLKNNSLTFEYEKLTGEFHGSGCTLSSTIAALLAQKMTIAQAAQNALDFTWQTLKYAHIHINNIHIPNRFFNQ